MMQSKQNIFVQNLMNHIGKIIKSQSGIGGFPKYMP